jgi:RimJ/RimL family protein N-acetyltransferase
MQVFLETERLVLRRFTTADVDNLVSLDADPDVMRFVNGGKPTSREEIENEFLPAFLGYYQRYQEYGFWAAIERSTGEFLGWFPFRPRDPAVPEQAELGYRLRKSAFMSQRRSRRHDLRAPTEWLRLVRAVVRSCSPSIQR